MRISSLPTFVACPSSQLAVDHPYNPPSDAAALGTAAHAGLAEVAMGRVPDIDAIAVAHGVDPNELGPLAAYGASAWREVGQHFPQPRTEQPLEGDGIRGTCDVLHHDGVACTVADWKTNRARADYGAQLLGYAAAAVHQFGMPESGEVKVITVWVRLGEYDVTTVRADDIERLYHDIARAQLDIGKRYAPGDACTYCRRQLVCDARHEYVRSAVAALVPVGGAQIAPASISALYPQAQALAKALKAYTHVLRLTLAEHGPQSDGEGGTLALADTTKETLKARESWPVLTEAGFSDDDIAACVSMSKTAVLAIVNERAEKGQKGKAKGALLDRMREAHAVVSKTSTGIKHTKGKR